MYSSIHIKINTQGSSWQCFLAFELRVLSFLRWPSKKSVFVRVGDAVTLPCLLNRSWWGEGARMGWFRDRRNLYTNHDLHRDFPNEENTLRMFNNNKNITGHGVTEGDFSLLISPVRFDDSGTFTCFHNNLSRHKRTTITEDFSLTISDVRPKDSGHYECRSDRVTCNISVITLKGEVYNFIYTRYAYNTQEKWEI
uniref:Ig-like domain-containing protein n=1 Tax=Eptatretus burgeri TaxID=7764 RepID=A0A8C4NF90_EPTBU